MTDTNTFGYTSCSGSPTATMAVDNTIALVDWAASKKFTVWHEFDAIEDELFANISTPEDETASRIYFGHSGFCSIDGTLDNASWDTTLDYIATYYG